MPETKKEISIRREVMKKTLELMTAALSLVAALAWNDAIQAIFLKIFGPQSSVVAKLIYATAVTVIVVYVGFKLVAITKKIDEGREERLNK
ncbi:MAG: DUF5654 family protein [Patescibacteria group bacterium]